MTYRNPSPDTQFSRFLAFWRGAQASGLCAPVGFLLPGKSFAKKCSPYTPETSVPLLGAKAPGFPEDLGDCYNGAGRA